MAVARQEDPEGAGRAALLIVGGRPGSRGVVCSASYECRAFGVRSAMPIARALKLCPEAMCVPVPRQACSTRSKEIQAVLVRFAPVVQASSIDEWYCDLGGTEALYGHEPLRDTAHRIRQAVFEATWAQRVHWRRHVAARGQDGLWRWPSQNPGPGPTVCTAWRRARRPAFSPRSGWPICPWWGPKLAEKLERMGLIRVARGPGLDGGGTGEPPRRPGRSRGYTGGSADSTTASCPPATARSR
ncbi:MAG: hypothetical protein HEQ38_10645 [Gemmatimonas sp.]|nr:hypothetical protein [Gemmatimonas sp.]